MFIFCNIIRFHKYCLFCKYWFASKLFSLQKLNVLLLTWHSNHSKKRTQTKKVCFQTPTNVFILIISSQDSDITRTHFFSQLLFATVYLQQLFCIIYSAFFINKQKYHSFGYWSPSLFYRFYSCAIIDSQISVNFSVKSVKKCSVFLSRCY